MTGEGRWDPDEDERHCPVCLEDLPKEAPADVAVCPACENKAREDAGEPPVSERPW